MITVDYPLFPNIKSAPIIGMDDLQSRLTEESLYALKTTTFLKDDVRMAVLGDNTLDSLIKFAKVNSIKTIFYESVFTEQNEHLITEEMLEVYDTETIDSIEAEIEEYNDMVSGVDYSSPAALLVFVRCNENVSGIFMTNPEMDAMLRKSSEDVLEWLIGSLDKVCAICENDGFDLYETKDGQLVCEDCANKAQIDCSQIRYCGLFYIKSKLIAYSRRNSSEITARMSTPVNPSVDVGYEEEKDTAENECRQKHYCTICNNDAGREYLLTEDRYVICISCARKTDFNHASINKHSRHEIKERISSLSDDEETYRKLPCANCGMDVRTFNTHYSTLDKQLICKACASLTGINSTHIKGHNLKDIQARITANTIDHGHWKSDNDSAPSNQNMIIYPNGDKYQGERSEGLPHGRGILCYSDGEKYVGDFKNGIADGMGTFIYLNGDKYKGEFRNGLRNGRGVLHYVNGDRYEGMFEDDDIVNGEGKTIHRTANTDIKKITPGDSRNSLSYGINWNNQNW